MDTNKHTIQSLETWTVSNLLACRGLASHWGRALELLEWHIEMIVGRFDDHGLLGSEPWIPGAMEMDYATSLML